MAHVSMAAITIESDGLHGERIHVGLRAIGSDFEIFIDGGCFADGQDKMVFNDAGAAFTFMNTVVQQIVTEENNLPPPPHPAIAAIFHRFKQHGPFNVIEAENMMKPVFEMLKADGTLTAEHYYVEWSAMDEFNILRIRVLPSNTRAYWLDIYENWTFEGALRDRGL